VAALVVAEGHHYRALAARDECSRSRGTGRAPTIAASRRAVKARAAPVDERVRRRFERDLHSENSHRVLNGMMGRLAPCESLSGSSDGAQGPFRASNATHASLNFPPSFVLRAFGAEPLAPAEAPGLYALLINICARAQMRRAPELFLLPVSDMNAFALGAPDNGCIAVTQGCSTGSRVRKSRAFSPMRSPTSSIATPAP
jgi:hypothetical protein